MKIFAPLLAAVLAAAGASASAPPETDGWAAYLDYAYVYSSADAAPLRERLAAYGREAGMPLDRYITEHFVARPGSGSGSVVDETETRREAVAWLLDYLADGEPESLEASVRAISKLEDRLGRHENRYWYHYIRAHRAIEKGRRHDFVSEVLDLWRRVVVPLEEPYEALQTLALDQAPNSGFASALPYVYENVARLVLLRAPHMGIDRDLDPLGSLVRMLHDGRVGAHPEVIPPEASSRAYLDRIVTRLDGPESDAGSLTFTLALFEASRRHEEARGLLAREGLSPRTLDAMRVAGGAYATALDRAHTVQGRCAVHARALRQIGEIYAARQRLGVDPELELPFGIEDAMDVYADMHERREEWMELGYAAHGHRAFVAAMRGLWEEIQEATLNVADYYLSASVDTPHRADESARTAARLYTRYLSFFLRYVDGEGREGVPDSAYFAAHEAARGIGDAFLLYARHPRTEEVELAVERYRAAMQLFPFDRTVWSSLAAALEHQGRESDFLDLVRPAAEGVTRSRAVDTWISRGEPEAERVDTLRRAFSDTLSLMYLGFAEADGLAELRASLEELRAQRREVGERLAALEARRRGGTGPQAPAAPDPTAAPASTRLDAATLIALNRDIDQHARLAERLDRQIEARTRTLPLYEAALGTDGLAEALRSRRDHPVHKLLRRMYHEDRG